MTVATKARTAAPKATTKARAAAPKATPANPVLTPEQEAAIKLQARLTELKAAYAAARTGETKTKGLLKAAKLQWENSRVITSRIVYAVAMLKPLPDGKHNLSYAARELHMTDADLALTGDALKTKTNSAKGSLRNYANAGAALDADGYAYSTDEPTDAERKIVAEAFSAGNKRPGAAGKAADNKADKGESEGGNGGGESTPPADKELTAYDLMVKLSEMNAILGKLKAAETPVSEEEAADIAAMAKGFTDELSAYVNK